MSQDLLQSYFERDLSEDELQRLSLLLETGEENAAQFAGLAATAYVALGIPARPLGHAGLGPTVKGLLALVAGIGISVAVWQGFYRIPDVPPATLRRMQVE